MNNDKSPRITLIPDKPALAAGRESRFDLLIRIEAPPPAAVSRRPINLGLVLDRSGSMQGQKLIHARQAMAFAVRNMRPEDRVSLVVYDTTVNILVRAGTVAEVGPRVLAELERVRALHSTALHEGWVQGGLQVSAAIDPGGVNRVLLVSDGLANVGETRTEVLVARAAELFARGVSTSTIGVGSDFNEDLMIPMAVSGGGAGWFVETPDDFRRIFEAELAGLTSLFGERGVLKLEPCRAGVEVVEVMNGFTRVEGGWGVGALTHGQPLEIIVTMKARGGEPGQPLDLMEVGFEVEAVGGGKLEQRAALRIGCDDPAVVDAMPLNAEVQKVVALLMAARARVEAISHADRGDYGSACESLRVACVSLEAVARDGDPDVPLDKAEIEELIKLYSAGDPAAVNRARKQAAYQSYSSSSGSRLGGTGRRS